MLRNAARTSFCLLLLAWATSASAQNAESSNDGSQATAGKDETTAGKEKIAPTPASQGESEAASLASNSQLDKGFSLILGIGFSGLLSRARSTQYESNKSGHELFGQVVGSLFRETWAVEAGGGWYFGQMRGKIAGKVSPQGSDHSEITVQATYLALSGLYRMSPAVMFGPLTELRLGTETCYSPFDNARRKPLALAGAQIALGTPRKLGDTRIGAHFLTDVNIAERQIWMLGLSLSLGVPIFKPEDQVREREVFQEKLTPVQRVEPRFVYSPDVDMVEFVSGTADPTPVARAYLKGLGLFLVETIDAWQGLDIGGHTGQLGSQEKELALSQGRAEAVKEILVGQGVPPDRLRTWAFGAKRPLTSSEDPVARRRNERIDLSFQGVRNLADLRAELDKLHKENHQPKTCGATGCK